MDILVKKVSTDIDNIRHLEAPNITKALSLDALFDIAAVLGVSPHKFLLFEDD